MERGVGDLYGLSRYLTALFGQFHSLLHGSHGGVPGVSVVVVVASVLGHAHIDILAILRLSVRLRILGVAVVDMVLNGSHVGTTAIVTGDMGGVVGAPVVMVARFVGGIDDRVHVVGLEAHATAIERYVAQGTHTAVARGIDEEGIAIDVFGGVKIITEAVLILVYLLLHDRRAAGGQVVEVLALEHGTADIEEAITAMDTDGRSLIGIAAMGVDGIGRGCRRGCGTVGE